MCQLNVVFLINEYWIGVDWIRLCRLFFLCEYIGAPGIFAQCLPDKCYVCNERVWMYTETVDQLYRTIDFPVLPAAAMYAVARMYGTKSEESFLLWRNGPQRMRGSITVTWFIAEAYGKSRDCIFWRPGQHQYRSNAYNIKRQWHYAADLKQIILWYYDNV